MCGKHLEIADMIDFSDGIFWRHSFLLIQRDALPTVLTRQSNMVISVSNQYFHVLGDLKGPFCQRMLKKQHQRKNIYRFEFNFV